MKLRIMQQGGGLIYTPFIPGAQSTTATASKSSSSNDDSKLDPLDKELISLMKDQNLLSSDIQQIYNRLIRFQKQTQRLSGLEGTDAYRSAMPGMLQILGMVNEAKSNKEDAKEVEERMIAENAGSDIALDNYGRMYVLSDGKLDTVAISKFDPEKHQALSNSQMLSYRENELPFDKSILSGLRNMVGMSSISKEIERMIKAIGTKEESQYITANANVKKVLSAIADGPDGIYKLSAKERSEGLQPAWKAIYDNLPKNMQNVIRANAAVAGTDYRAIIQDMVLRQTDTKFDVNYDSTISKAAGYDTDPNKTTKEAAEQLTQNNYLQRVGSLRGDRTIVSIAPRGAQISDTAALSAHAFTFGAVIDRNNKPIEKMSLSDLMKNGWAFAAGEPNDVTFGNKLLKDWERDAIMFDDNSNLTAVMLPYRNQGGHIVPDFELLESFNKIQRIIQDNPNISKTELSSILIQNGISPSDINYDVNNNTISLKNTMAFLTVSGYAGDETIDLTKADKRYLEKISKSDGQHIKDYYNNLVKYGKLRPAKKGNVTIKGYSTSGSNDFWRGNIFIPMKNAFNAMNLSGIGEYVPKDQESNFYERVAAKQQESALQQYVRDNDPNYTQHTQLGQFRYE